MKKSIWLWEWSQQAEKDPAAVAATLAQYCPSVETVLVKVMDGNTWMNAFDPLAPSNLQEWVAMRSGFESEGLEAIPWVVAQEDTDAASHIVLCDDSHTELVIDLEPYPGFWQGGDFNSYLDKLTAFGPGSDSYHAWISIDPRTAAMAAINIQTWASRVWGLLPQLYWPDFQENPWNSLAYAENCTSLTGSTWPVYSYAASPTDLLQFDRLCACVGVYGLPSLWRLGIASAAQLAAFDPL